MRGRPLPGPTLAVMLAALLVGACPGGGASDGWVVIRPEPTGGGEPIRIAGTVRHLDLEGGLYVIRAADGVTYNPTNLPTAFRADGRAVEAEGRRRDDMASIGMVGPIVDLVRIRERPDTGAAIAGPSAIGAAVTGTVTYRERMALPPDAVIDVQLLDVSKQDVAATTIAETAVTAAGRQVPIPFELAYDSAAIDERNTYAVRAVIRRESVLLFTTDTHYPVITRGAPSRVDLVLIRVR